MKHALFKILTVLFAISLGLSSVALDLPVKKIGGEQVYYYKVKKGESIYGISKHIGLSMGDILRHNPWAADGVKKGNVLYFPYDEYAEHEPEVVVEEIVEVEDTVANKRPAISLLLPFGLNSSEPSRRNKLALDFYKGFLLGADTLSRRSGTIEIYVYDTEDNSRSIADLMSDPFVAQSAVIVAPDDKNIYDRMAPYALENGNFLLNVFTIADTLYASNPAVLQANIQQKQMYRLAVDALMADFDGYTPVILRSEKGKNEKEGFTAYLAERYRNEGVEPLTINYESNLLAADLDVLNHGEKYVVVPSSGALSEFNKFAYVLKSYRDRRGMIPVEGEEIELKSAEIEIFGYPDWTAFRGDALDTLHKLEATVYSRFYDNFSDYSTRNIEASFKTWYGTEIIESIPSYALLGYDTACMLIKNLRANGGTFDPVNPQRYSGVQSTFDFEKVSTDAGYCNSTLYIIRYQAGGRTTGRTI